MRRLFLSSLMIMTGMVLLFTACKKDKSDDDDSTEQFSGSDASRFGEESDQILSDADDILSGSSLAGGRIGAVTICGATVDSSTISGQKTITLTFDGTTSCVNNTRTRSGSIVLTLTNGSHWSDAGAVLSITLNNYKVTRISDGKYIVLNGTKTITNVNGGLIKDVYAGNITSVEHRIQASSLTLTFDNGSQRTWSTDRTRVITKSGGDLVATISGNATEGGYSNIATWGTNRFGSAFYCQISNPVEISNCVSAGRWKAIDGTLILKGLRREVTIDYGVNIDGSSNGTCSAYGFKVSWIAYNGNARQAIISY